MRSEFVNFEKSNFNLTYEFTSVNAFLKHLLSKPYFYFDLYLFLVYGNLF